MASSSTVFLNIAGYTNGVVSLSAQLASAVRATIYSAIPALMLGMARFIWSGESGSVRLQTPKP